MISTTIIVVAVLVAAVWIIIEAKRLKHKVVAIALIGLIIFTYISFTVITKDKDINFKDPDDLQLAGKLYFSWLGTLFGNVKTITANAINMEWNPVENETGSGG